MEFLPFFLVLITGVFFSTIFRRFHLPWVIALIVAGITVGPHGLALIETNTILDFMATIGLIFLMFMAGLETKLSSFRQFRSGVLGLAAINGMIPFAVGFGIGYLFGFSTLASLLLGIIFISSSIAVVIPSLESNGILHTRLGKSIVSATIIEDVASLVLLSLLLQTIDPVTQLPLPLFYLLLFGVLILLRFLLPVLRQMFSPGSRGWEDLFQQEVRTIFTILIGTVVSFELLGLHPIIAGFFAGLVLSDSIKNPIVIEKLRTISYGLFIPVFFVVVGIDTDLSALASYGTEAGLVAAVVFGSMAAKFISGFLGGRMIGFGKREAAIVGTATIPQLSTTLAVVFTAVELGLLQSELITAMVLLSMVTTFVAPLALKMLVTHKDRVAPVASGANKYNEEEEAMVR